MFRKNYKEANDSIKPNEAFVKSVLQKAKRKKPPAYARYRKYAVSAAAAVVIVSAAVIAMPVWRGVVDKSDGVIVEERAVTTSDSAQENTPAKTTPDATEKPENKVGEESADNTEKSSGDENANNTSKKAGASSGAHKTTTATPKPSDKTSSTSKPSSAASNHSSGVSGGPSSSVSAKTDAPAKPTPTEKSETNNTAANNVTTDEAAAAEETAQGGSAENDSPKLKSVVEDNSDYAPAEDKQEVYVQSARADDADFESARGSSAIPDTSLPTPAGYYCTRAEWNGYTFVNDNGAVIIVSISYGGEDSGPYYSQDGDNINAGFTAYGMTVSVSASGADMATVQEIINSLR